MDFSRKSASPLLRSKFAVNEIEKLSDIDEEPINQSEETSEIASQLALIRKKHDKTKESNLKKASYYEKLKSEIEKLTLSSTLADQDIKSLHQKSETLKQSLNQSQKKHAIELFNKKSYQHMLDRIKKNKIALEIKANSLEDILKSLHNDLNTETNKFIKIRENQFQSKLVLQEIKMALAQDQKKKTRKILKLEKYLKEKQEMISRREERLQRQLGVSEAAVSGEKDLQEAKIREKLLLYRMWSVFLRKKLEKELYESISIENAFQKVKTYSGVSDINEILDSFLNKDQNYSTLVQTVSKSEEKLQFLRENNKKLREKLNQVQYNDGNNRKIYNEIEDIEHNLSVSYKEYAVIKEKLQKSIVLYDQVLNWGLKIFYTLDIGQDLDISPGSKVVETKNTLDDMFETIYNRLEQLIQPIRGKSEENRKAIELFAKKKTVDIVEDISANHGLAKLPKIQSEDSEDHEKEKNKKNY